jgi:hypothetical protein
VLTAALDSAAAHAISGDDRVLSTADWGNGAQLVDGLLAVFAVGASLVQVANPDPDILARRRSTENITRTL